VPQLAHADAVAATRILHGLQLWRVAWLLAAACLLSAGMRLPSCWCAQMSRSIMGTAVLSLANFISVTCHLAISRLRDNVNFSAVAVANAIAGAAAWAAVANHGWLYDADLVCPVTRQSWEIVLAAW